MLVIALFSTSAVLDSGYYSPGSTGYPNNDWTGGTNVKASDNNRAYETDLYELLDTYDYGIDLPDGATVVGIEVRVEGFSALYQTKPVPGYYCPE